MKMKKILVLAIAALPLFAFAQDKKETVQKSDAKTTEKPVLTNPENIFIELVVTQGPVGSIIKADVGRESITTLSDKELVKQLGELRTTSFSNMPDALNFLASIGFKYQNSYIVYDKDGKAETHLVFEKRINKKPAGDGTSKPARPERPAVDTKGEGKPTDTKPTEKKPAPKPVEKK